MKTRTLFSTMAAVATTLALGAAVVQAQDSTVIRIASQSPLSGPQASLGTGIRNGVELAIEQLSGPLEELGYTVEFVPYDDQATAETGVSNAQQIVNDESILAVIGHLNSGVAIPSSEVYNDNDLVMISPANTATTITDRGYPTVNRVCGRDDAQGPIGAAFAAEELEVQNVYILHDTTAYGQPLAEFFRDEAESLGIEILGFEGTEEAANFGGILQPILAQEPELIYFGGIYSQTAIFIAQARDAGYEGYFMGGDGFDSSEFASLAGPQGIVDSYYTTVAVPAQVVPEAQQFATDYQELFGETPQPFAAQSYDATGIALAAIARAIEAEGGLPSRAAVAAEVRATENYQGYTGTITFDDNGDPEEGLYYFVEVTSDDPAEWLNNRLVGTRTVPSPLMAAMEGGMEMTPEATPGS